MSTKKDKQTKFIKYMDLRPFIIKTKFYYKE